MEERTLQDIKQGKRFRMIYLKKDNTERAATGVILPEHRDNFLYNGYVRYFDLGIMAYRSFHVNNIQRIDTF